MAGAIYDSKGATLVDIEAEPGSTVVAYGNARVKAASGSLVLKHKGAVIDAAEGATVIEY